MATVAAVSSLVFSAYAISESERSKGEAEKIGELNAAAVKDETTEIIRKTKTQQEAYLASARARSGSSGIKSGSGSTTEFFAEMQKQFKSDIDWIEKSGASQASIQQAQGRLGGQQARAQSWGIAANATSSLSSMWA